MAGLCEGGNEPPNSLKASKGVGSAAGSPATTLWYINGGRTRVSAASEGRRRRDLKTKEDNQNDEERMMREERKWRELVGFHTPDKITEDARNVHHSLHNTISGLLRLNVLLFEQCPELYFLQPQLHSTDTLSWRVVESKLVPSCDPITRSRRDGVVSPSPNPQAGGPPLIGCPRLLIRSYSPYLEAVSSIRNMRTRHAVVIGTNNTWHQLFIDFKNTDDSVKKEASGLYNILIAFELNSVTRVKRRIWREWNVDPPTRKSIYEWDRTLRDNGSLISKTGIHSKKHVAEMTVDQFLSFSCRIFTPYEAIGLREQRQAVVWRRKRKASAVTSDTMTETDKSQMRDEV
ncbi:hypothetical protein ANN_21030 [Periplaneta americana]|uniref:Uncharacterized protein n=1 Tax=Periplaneta americana TaxID=6978 RepID=A0ABQ8SFE5_PERAM|nr:hypothetical protein ANN_21030 [Periplaneta americana]